jgi:hypothetical protein
MAKPTDWGWHRYATDYVSPFGYNFAKVPEATSWWCPTVHSYGGPQLSPMYAPTTITRWEAQEFIEAELRKGRAVEVWDACPTTPSKLKFAAGPCTPLTCAIGRPMRGAAPRYH